METTCFATRGRGVLLILFTKEKAIHSVPEQGSLFKDAVRSKMLFTIAATKAVVAAFRDPSVRQSLVPGAGVQR